MGGDEGVSWLQASSVIAIVCDFGLDWEEGWFLLSGKKDRQPEIFRVGGQGDEEG